MAVLTMREAITEALREELRQQPNLVLLGQDIGAYGGTFGVYRGLFDEFGPDRVRDGPLCESSTVGFGIGLAITGMRCVVELEFMDFVTVAMDQIVNQAGKMHSFRKSETKAIQKEDGISLMPPFGDRIKGEDLDDLVAYLASLGGVR